MGQDEDRLKAAAANSAAALVTDGMIVGLGSGTTAAFAVDAIGAELNSQYMLSYRPTGSDSPGYHQIKITVNRPGVKVRTRPGYFLEAK